jgi:hypothetical protein
MRRNAALSAITCSVLLGLLLSVMTSPAAQRAAAVQQTPTQTETGTKTATDRAATLTATPVAQAVRLRSSWRENLSHDYVVNDVGCAADTSAAGLNAFFAKAVGPIKGHDEPRITPLDDGRVLWVLQDTFIDYRGDIGAFTGMDYVNNSVLIQDGKCFTMLQGGTATKAESFELGDAGVNFDRFFWPGGSTVTNGKLYQFWIEMNRDYVPMGWLDGLATHPSSTWIATYDLATMKRLDFRPAPNKGATPVYGYAVTDDGDWTYLFGNSDQQNLALEGGYENGPHSATKMYLARVPRGHVMTPPTYWTGAGWSTDPVASVPISDRFFTENIMLPIVMDGRWISATKVDGFTGTSITIDVADNPWGPYTTIKTLLAVPHGDPTGMTTYHAAIIPWLDPSGALILSLSQIPADLSQPSALPLYRPQFFTVAI